MKHHKKYTLAIKECFTQTPKIHILLSTHGTCSKTDSILRYKTGLKKCRSSETVSCVLADHHGYPARNQRQEKLKKTYRE